MLFSLIMLLLSLLCQRPPAHTAGRKENVNIVLEADDPFTVSSMTISVPVSMCCLCALDTCMVGVACLWGHCSAVPSGTYFSLPLSVNVVFLSSKNGELNLTLPLLAATVLRVHVSFVSGDLLHVLG